MKKAVFIFAITIIATTCVKAQQIRYTYDPFREGDKYISVEAGLGGWLGGKDYKLTNTTSGPYAGYNATKMSRDPFNPNLAIVYKRVLENDKISWGNNFRLAMNWWHGTVEGVSTTNPSKTFTTDYKYSNVDFSSLYYAMIHVGDDFEIDAGFGLSLGFSMMPKSTISYSDGTPTMNTEGGLDIMDLLTCTIDFMVGVEYHLTESISFSGNLIGYPIDFFGLLGDEETKGMKGVGEGLYVSKKFPYQLTFGFIYAL